MAKLALVTNGYAKGENRGGEILKTYLYLDENKKPYHRIDRTEHHQFPQYIWGPVGKDGDHDDWIPKQPKVKIPYMLPELLEAKPEEPVFICEGEKDADTVYKLGFVATTNPSGAGKWNGKDLNKWFKGKHTVYILEDNDEPGFLHAAMVAKEMHSIGVKNVFIVHFHDLKEKQDVTDWVEEYGGTAEKLLDRCKNAVPLRHLPLVVVEMANLPHAATLLEKHIKDSKQPVLNRGGQLVHAVFSHWENNIRGKMRTTQTTKLIPMDEITLHDIARKWCCEFRKWDGRAKEYVPCPPPSQLLQMVLSRGSHSPFPKVRGCINAPTLRDDGSILSEQGWDKRTGFWHYRHEGAKLPDDMPKKPTKADAEKALATLKSLFKEVRFSDEHGSKELNQAVAIAAIMTGVCRGAFVTAPMFLFTAPASGTGKSYMVDIVSHIVQGTWCSVINLGGPKEEREKRIGGILLQGTNMISMDNLENDLNDVVLNQMLTQPIVNVRALGSSDIIQCEWRGTIFATGNGVQLVSDLIRRGLTCTLDAKMAEPEKRKFKFDPIEVIMDDRGKYIAAALTIARAYHFAKGAKEQAPLVSFEGWSHFIKDSLLWLGEPNVLDVMTIARAADPGVRSAEEFVSLWAEGKVLKPGQAYRVTEMIKAVEDAMSTSAMKDLLMVQAGAAGGRPLLDARRLGWWLRSLKGKIIAGHTVALAKASHHGHGWVLLAAPKA